MATQKLVIVKRGATKELDNLLSQGWKIKTISSYSEPVANSYRGYSPICGEYGCYVVIEKEN